MARCMEGYLELVKVEAKWKVGGVRSHAFDIYRMMEVEWLHMFWVDDGGVMESGRFRMHEEITNIFRLFTLGCVSKAI